MNDNEISLLINQIQTTLGEKLENILFFFQRPNWIGSWKAVGNRPSRIRPLMPVRAEAREILHGVTPQNRLSGLRCCKTQPRKLLVRALRQSCRLDHTKTRALACHQASQLRRGAWPVSFALSEGRIFRLIARKIRVRPPRH